MGERPRLWIVLRGLIAFSGLSLMVYVAYRYLIGGPPDAGSVYGVIFPGSVLLAAAAVLLAVSPRAFHGVRGPGGRGLRAALVGLGLVWMGTGLLCLESLAAGVAAAPFQGSLNLFHMLTHHVVIPVALVLLAGVPGWTVARTGLPSAGRPAAAPGRSARGSDGSIHSTTGRKP